MLISAPNIRWNHPVFHLETHCLEADVETLQMVEKTLPSLETIVLNPAYSMKSKRELKRVEQAKNMDAETILHLASHSQFAHLDNDQRIRPEMLSTKASSDEIDTYENRFIKSLLFKVSSILSSFYRKMADEIPSFSEIKAEFEGSRIDEQNEPPYVLRVSLSLRRHSEGEISALGKVKEMRTSIQRLIESPLIRALKNSKGVLEPITRTNRMLHDPCYQQAVKLWTFLHVKSQEGISIKTQKTQCSMDEDFTEKAAELARCLCRLLERSQKEAQDP